MTLRIETGGPPGTLGISGMAVLRLAAEGARAGNEFALEDDLGVDRLLPVRIEQDDDVAVVRRTHHRLDFGDLVPGARAERDFHQCAAEAQARVGRAAARPRSSRVAGWQIARPSVVVT